jgi:hypothetical protein
MGARLRVVFFLSVDPVEVIVPMEFSRLPLLPFRFTLDKELLPPVDVGTSLGDGLFFFPTG